MALSRPSRQQVTQPVRLKILHPSGEPSRMDGYPLTSSGAPRVSGRPNPLRVPEGAGGHKFRPVLVGAR